MNPGIYLHSPFCARKCLYCAFYSMPYDEELAKKYADALRREIFSYADQKLRIPTIYWGGGTPSLLPDWFLADITEVLHTVFDCAEVVEFTLEVNPEDVTPEKINIWQAIGVNRISMGVQSFNDSLLERLGRRHDAARAKQALRLLMDTWDNISIDLMSNLPRQTDEDWRRDLATALEFQPQHISIYPLQLEEGTPLNRSLRLEEYEGMEEEFPLIWETTREKLTSAGYLHYEISNYARPNFMAVHNSNYWRYLPYLGFGPSASSFFNNRRWTNVSDLREYIAGAQAIVDKDSEKLENQMAEYIFLHLRLLEEGLNPEAFYMYFGQSLTELYGQTVQKLLKYGWIEEKGSNYVLAKDATAYANQVFMEFIP